MIKLKSLLKERRGKKLPREVMEAELNRFSFEYINTALSTETDNLEPSGGNPLNAYYTLDDIEADTFARIIFDCRDFQKKYKKLYEEGGWSDADAGKDFWYSRNGHGTGFWDVGIGDSKKEEIGKLLHRAAKSYGGYSLYLGDEMYDGMILGIEG